MKTKKIPFNIERAKAGAKVVTRGGCSVRIADYAIKDKEHPILGLVDSGRYETPETFTDKGRAISNNVESDYDLFIEEEVEEEHNNFEIMPDKWYLCTREVCLWLKNEKNYTSFMEGVSYLGADILECDLSFEHEFYQNYFRYWDINDAKDGDVLCYETKDEFRIFIYKNGHVHFHCHYYNGHLTTVDSYFVIPKYLLCYIHPATKEQCDLLFQKIKEAGYEWDSDKKELKKIAPKFKVGDKVVLKWDKSFVGSITSVSLEGTYSIKSEDFRVCWYSEQELEPCEMIEKDVKTRRMTNQELAWWLRDSPEEHRECSTLTGDCGVFDRHIYYDEDANKPVKDGIIIRKNGGEWEEPLVEI